jgi:hypothetical protein
MGQALHPFRAFAGRCEFGTISFCAISRQQSAAPKNHMFPEASFVKMYYFALDFDGEMPYPLAPPQGWEAIRSLKTKN